MQVDMFGATLAVCNGIAAVLNIKCFAETRTSKDFWGSVAWIGSTAYWIVRGVFLT